MAAELNHALSPAGAAAPPAEAWYNRWLERDLVPDWLIRIGIRRLCAQRLRDEDERDPQKQQARLARFIAEMRASPSPIDRVRIVPQLD